MRAFPIKTRDLRAAKLSFAMCVSTLSLFALAGCHLDMWRQPKVRGQQESNFFADGSAMRLPVKHTVARGMFQEDEAFATGFSKGKLVDTIPMPVTQKTLERGQDRFNIYCAPCHGKIGDGNGMIATRGLALKRPPGNYHTDRLRKMPVGHFYDVIVNGYGAMFSYAARIQDPKDRWAIAAYVRVLQASQNATLNEVPAEERGKLEASVNLGKAASIEAKGEEGH